MKVDERDVTAWQVAADAAAGRLGLAPSIVRVVHVEPISAAQRRQVDTAIQVMSGQCTPCGLTACLALQIGEATLRVAAGLRTAQRDIERGLKSVVSSSA